jgi:surface antigen
VHGIANNSAIDITCQVQGQVVNGSDIWNQLADGTFVSDFYCDTSNFNGFSPPIPVCADAPQPSPGQPGIKGDDYPNKDAPIDQPDQWQFDCRECTSFVAWRMNQLGVNFTNGMSGPNGTQGWFGNGDTWAANAIQIGFGVDNTPSVGAIAHYNPNVSGAGDMGHVAYVAQVNGDGTIVLEEYNWAVAYAYHDPPRVINASDVSDFIHIV